VFVLFFILKVLSKALQGRKTKQTHLVRTKKKITGMEMKKVLIYKDQNLLFKHT